METQTPATAPAPAKRAPRKTGKTAKTAPKSGKIALKTICSQMKVEPKAARRKLRRSELAFHDKRDRWTFTEAQATRVRELLRELKAN